MTDIPVAEGTSSLALAISIASFAAAAASAVFAAVQARHAANAAAITAVQHFMIQSRELWEECDTILSEQPIRKERLQRCVSDIVGHFEVAMTLVAEGVVEGKPRRLIEGTVRDYVAHMSSKGFAPYVAALIDDDEVCENLRDFCVQSGRRLKNREAVFAMLKIPSSSL